MPWPFAPTERWTRRLAPAWVSSHNETNWRSKLWWWTLFWQSVVIQNFVDWRDRKLNFHFSACWPRLHYSLDANWDGRKDRRWERLRRVGQIFKSGKKKEIQRSAYSNNSSDDESCLQFPRKAVLYISHDHSPALIHTSCFSIQFSAHLGGQFWKNLEMWLSLLNRLGDRRGWVNFRWIVMNRITSPKLKKLGQEAQSRGKFYRNLKTMSEMAEGVKIQ